MDNNKNKGLNTNSNTYTIVYSIVIVVIVAFLLAFVFQMLKARQDENVAADKKKQILASLNIRDIPSEEVGAKYAEVVLSDDVIDASGKVTQQGEKGGDKAGFALNSADFKAGRLALYVCNIDGQTKYVIPVYGMGLWGAISGYIAIDEDKETVYGAYFNHDSETAGLGSEIKDNRKWQEQFRGKKLFAEGTDGIALTVKKKNDVTDPSTQCDGVTGATLTSDGVSNMLKSCLGEYMNFFNAKTEGE